MIPADWECPGHEFTGPVPERIRTAEDSWRGDAPSDAGQGRFIVCRGRWRLPFIRPSATFSLQGEGAAQRRMRGVHHQNDTALGRRAIALGRFFSTTRTIPPAKRGAYPAWRQKGCQADGPGKEESGKEESELLERPVSRPI